MGHARPEIYSAVIFFTAFECLQVLHRTVSTIYQGGRSPRVLSRSINVLQNIVAERLLRLGKQLSYNA
jgi:hypothetical protein